MLKTNSADFIAIATLIATVLFVYVVYRLINRKDPNYDNMISSEKRSYEKLKFKHFQAVVLAAGAVIVYGIGAGAIYYAINHQAKVDKDVNNMESKEKEDDETFYDYLANEMIAEVNDKYGKQNFLISPYSMTIALEMLRDGASGDTRAEIDNLLQHREMIERINIPGKVATANGLFVKEKYKGDILDSYYKLIKEGYEGDILYDSFETPKVINDWISKNTNKMIKEPIKSIDKDFVLGIFNATAIDVEWKNKFECTQTISETFYEGEKEYDVEMMHQEYQQDAKYFELSDSEGVILPYKTYDSKGKETDKGTTLEFIAFLPKLDLDNYLSFRLFKEEYPKIDKEAKNISNDTRLELFLPRFEYDFSFDEFAESLKNVGVKSAFQDDANFSNISKTKDDIKVGSAVHETYIKLGETGTKAAAVTGFAMVGNAYMPEDYETIRIRFNKPFLYLIRDSKTKEILFIGGVYKPNLWKGETCQNDTN